MAAELTAAVTLAVSILALAAWSYVGFSRLRYARQTRQCAESAAEWQELSLRWQAESDAAKAVPRDGLHAVLMTVAGDPGAVLARGRRTTAADR